VEMKRALDVCANAAGTSSAAFRKARREIVEPRRSRGSGDL